MLAFASYLRVLSLIIGVNSLINCTAFEIDSHRIRASHLRVGEYPSALILFRNFFNFAEFLTSPTRWSYCFIAPTHILTGDLVDEPPEDMSPSKARSTLTDEVVALQRNVSSLLVLRGGDTRRAQLDDLRRELQERQEDLRVLDSMYDTSVRVVPRQNVASLGA